MDSNLESPRGRRSGPRTVVAAGVVASAIAFGGRAAAQPVIERDGHYEVRLEDRARDDDGPGGYVYPSSQEYRRGSFDLLSLIIRRDGDELVFEVRFGADIWKPPETRRTDAQRFELENGIYVQHVDIYIDHTPEEGFTEALPGRNVTIEEASAWDVAVVLTPRPYLLQTLLGDWKPSRRVEFPSNLRSYKNVVEARVPIARLGAEPSPAWGYVVAVSGALWENTFDAFDRLIGGHVQNALTMPVVTVAEPRAFGGGELSFVHPFVVDVITPPGRSQSDVLSRYAKEPRLLAALPAVYPDPEAREEAVRAARERASAAAGERPTAAAPEGPTAKVRDVQGDLVVLDRADGEPAAFSIGSVLGPGDVVVARVVVTAVYPKFVLATLVEGAGKIAPGYKVQFSRSP